jgi:serine/threonine-protein kinase
VGQTLVGAADVSDGSLGIDVVTIVGEAMTGGGSNDETPRMSIVPGALVDNAYRVVRELGRGAMGVVVLAHDERLDRDVALKVIRSSVNEANFNVMFQSEARAMARVNHRNVVPIYASGEHEAVPYIVMEFVPGQTLEQFMEAADRHVDVETAVNILLQVCEGLSAIHGANTLHRDIKPSNILIGTDMRAAVTDFGVAVRADAERSRRPEMAGTPTYMAPEVAFPVPDQQANAAVDVYSLACVAYELFTGRPPFSGETQNQVILKHATVPPTPLTHLRPDLPPAFDRVVLDALAKDPSTRTQTVETFRQALLAANKKASDPLRILIAEDDADFRNVLEVALAREFEDAQIEAVPNGLLALQALGARPASVTILDLNMPGMDGMEVTKRLRSLDQSKTMPIIVLTGSGGPAEWRALSSIGADRFLVKPVSLDDLVAAVRHSLAERTKS